MSARLNWFCLRALPQVDTDTSLAAVLAYRFIYYGVPAGLALLALIRPFGIASAKPPRVALGHRRASRSETAVVVQNGSAILRRGASALALWPTGQTLTLFADPVAGSGPAALDHLREAAREETKLPAIYKCSGRLAASARADGWEVLHIADDALVDLEEFTINKSSRRTLRRKLRTASKAGVNIQSNCPLSYTAMAYVDARWQQANGPCARRQRRALLPPICRGSVGCRRLSQWEPCWLCQRAQGAGRVVPRPDAAGAKRP